MNVFEHSFVIDYGVPNSERIARIQRGNTKIQNCELRRFHTGRLLFFVVKNTKINTLFLP